MSAVSCHFIPPGSYHTTALTQIPKVLQTLTTIGGKNEKLVENIDLYPSSNIDFYILV